MTQQYWCFTGNSYQMSCEYRQNIVATVYCTHLCEKKNSQKSSTCGHTSSRARIGSRTIYYKVFALLLAVCLTALGSQGVLPGEDMYQPSLPYQDFSDYLALIPFSSLISLIFYQSFSSFIPCILGSFHTMAPTPHQDFKGIIPSSFSFVFDKKSVILLPCFTYECAFQRVFFLYLWFSGI